MQIVVTLFKVVQMLSQMAAVAWLALATQQKSVVDQMVCQYLPAKEVHTLILELATMALSAASTTLAVRER